MPPSLLLELISLTDGPLLNIDFSETIIFYVIKVRVIPIELQRLFARLLYLDQDSCSTEALTNSFGWNNSEVNWFSCF